MIKDIDFRKTEHIVLAATPILDEDTDDWKVFLVNLADEPINDVMVSSVGFGEKDDEQVKTSELRQHFDLVKGKAAVAIELITDELKGISNQFWVSYWYNGKLHDKKYVFLSESIVEENMINVPLIDKKGVVLK
ncbi:MAG: hypothetical protein WD048_11745 [Chitinophagales bacterium]